MVVERIRAGAAVYDGRGSAFCARRELGPLDRPRDVVVAHNSDIFASWIRAQYIGDRRKGLNKSPYHSRIAEFELSDIEWVKTILI
jgi:hypothetical protein